MIDTDDFLADLERHLRDAAERRDESRVRRRGALARVLRHQAAGFAPGRRRHAAAGLVPGRRRHAAAGLVPGRRSRDAGSGGLRPRLFRSGVLAVLAVAALAAVVAVGRGAPSPPPDDKAVATPSVASVSSASPHEDAQGRRIALQAAPDVQRAPARPPPPGALAPGAGT